MTEIITTITAPFRNQIVNVLLKKRDNEVNEKMKVTYLSEKYSAPAVTIERGNICRHSAYLIYHESKQLRKIHKPSNRGLLSTSNQLLEVKYQVAN